MKAFSSNYTLYGDMSRRVMEVLGGFSPSVEVYSIDESFLHVEDWPHAQLTAFGAESGWLWSCKACRACR